MRKLSTKVRDRTSHEIEAAQRKHPQFLANGFFLRVRKCAPLVETALTRNSWKHFKHSSFRSVQTLSISLSLCMCNCICALPVVHILVSQSGRPNFKLSDKTPFRASVGVNANDHLRAVSFRPSFTKLCQPVTMFTSLATFVVMQSLRIVSSPQPALTAAVELFLLSRHMSLQKHLKRTWPLSSNSPTLVPHVRRKASCPTPNSSDVRLVG